MLFSWTKKKSSRSKSQVHRRDRVTGLVGVKQCLQGYRGEVCVCVCGDFVHVLCRMKHPADV